MPSAHETLAALRPLHSPMDPALGLGDLFLSMALGLAVALIVAELWTLLRKRRTSIRRSALDELASSRTLSSEARLISQAKLLRNIVRALEGDAAARLHGDAWLAQMDATFATEFFTSGDGRAFGESLYRPVPHPEPEIMDREIQEFISRVRR